MAGEADRPYKPNIPAKVHIMYRHLPQVVAHCTEIAKRGARIGGDNWTVIVQNEPMTKRPRAYIAPKHANSEQAKQQDGAQSTVFKIISGLRGS